MHKLPESTTAIIPADAAREYFVPEDGEWEFYWIHMNGAQAGAMLTHLADTRGYVFCIGDRQTGIINSIEELLFMKNSGMPSFEAHASQVISSILHNLYLGNEGNGRSGAKEKSAVMELMRHLESNYGGKICMQTISRSLFVSAAHLARVFRANTGLRPMNT